MDQTQEQLLTELRAEKESLQRLLKSPEWALLVKFVKGQNEARQKESGLHVIGNLDEAFKHNRDVGFILGQRSVIMLPQSIVTIRDEEFQLMIEKEREDG